MLRLSPYIAYVSLTVLVYLAFVKVSMIQAQVTSTSTSVPPPTALVPSNTTVAVSNSTSATTTTTVATTSKPISPIPKPKPPAEPMRSPFCFCDQYVNKCEINCCCDLDCTPKDKQIFSSCVDHDLISRLGVSTKAKEQACYRQDFIYSNNTPFIVQYKSHDLFCIASNNFKREPVYDVPVAQFKSKFVKPSFRWTSLSALNVQKLKISTSGYKYGSLVLSAQQIETHNDTEFQVQYFDLPSNLHGKSCLGVEPLKFLQNSGTTCQYEMADSDFAAACDSTSTSNFNAQTFFNPNTTIIGKIDLKSSEDNLIHFNFAVCKDEKLDRCEAVDENKIPTPRYDSRSKQCNNILKIVQMTIVHEGTTGILNVLIQMHFANVPAPKSLSNANLEQEFRVRYLWKDEFQALISGSSNANASTNVTDTMPKRKVPDLPKSGNPGYLVGKEVIAGTMITNADVKSRKSSMAKEIGKSDNETLIKLQDVTPDDKEPFGVALFHDEGYHLSIINAGTCQHKRRRPVLFGTNMKSSCQLSLSRYKYCEELKKDLGLMLLGTNTANFSRRVVASFGDPFILQALPDWIPITILNNPFSSTPNSVSLIANGCNNGLITSLQIQIIHAYVGPVVFPQAQIRGVIYEFGDPIGSLKPAAGASKNRSRDHDQALTLSTTVEFHDITSVPVHKLAQWPTISVQLPSDFFYPFSSSRGSPNYSNAGLFKIFMLQIVVILVCRAHYTIL